MAGAPRALGVPCSRLALPVLLLMVALVVEGAPTTATAAPAVRTRPAQSVDVAVLPPIAQPGFTPAAPELASTVVIATVRPKTRGRRASLEVRRQGRWSVVATARTGAGGRVMFTAATTVDVRPAMYRVRAAAYRGLADVRSAPVRASAWGSPAFVDGFDGAALGPVWEHRIQFHNPWGGRSCSRGNPAAVAVGDGALRLSVLPDLEEAAPCYPDDGEGNYLGDVPYAYRLNGHVSTQQSADFQYGVAAARMRFPRDRGQHAAFWLQPRGLLPDRPTPWGAEIDVVEWFGSTGSRQSLASTVYRPAPDGSTVRIGGRYDDPDRFLDSRSDTWWGSYHVFSVEWTPTRYVFRIDGRETWRTSEGISHHPQFLILSQLSSDYELADNPDATPAHADVDWVQFWRARN